MKSNTFSKSATRAAIPLAVCITALTLGSTTSRAQLNESTGIVTGTNVSSATGSVTSSLNGMTFINQGLVGVGRISAAAIDGWGESLGSVSGLQIGNWAINGNDTYSGSFFFTPDRGYNDATFSNYAARIQQVDFSFAPYLGNATSGVAQNQFNLNYNAAGSTKLTYDAGGGNYVTTTGLIPDSSTTVAGKVVPYVTVSNGNGTNTTSGTTFAINRISLDTEGLVLKPDGSGYASDEYGATIYHFNAARQIDGVITPPAAIVPHLPVGTPVFSSEVSNANGRRGNQGMEGLALSQDGNKLFGLMQSATIQDTGTGNQGRLNTRLLVYDVSGATPTAPTAEYVLRLPILNDTGSGSPNKTAAQSEIVVIDDTHILVLSREGNGKGLTNTLAPVFKSILLVDLAAATNIAGTAYDAEGGDITPSGTTLAPGITPVSWTEAVNLLNTAQLGKFDLNLNPGATADLNSISEKWEGLSLVPTEVANEYFLFVGNDNDFLSSSTVMAGLDGTLGAPIDALDPGQVQNDTMFLAYRVTIVPEPCSIALLGCATAGLLGFRRRRQS